MLSRYSHIRTEAKRRAREEVQRNRAAARERLKQTRQQETAKTELPATTPLMQ